MIIVSSYGYLHFDVIQGLESLAHVLFCSCQHPGYAVTLHAAFVSILGHSLWCLWYVGGGRYGTRVSYFLVGSFALVTVWWGGQGPVCPSHGWGGELAHPWPPPFGSTSAASFPAVRSASCYSLRYFGLTCGQLRLASCFDWRYIV